MPFVIIDIVGDALVDARIIDQHIDAAVEASQCGLPNAPRRRSFGKVSCKQLRRCRGSNGLRHWRRVILSRA